MKRLIRPRGRGLTAEILRQSSCRLIVLIFVVLIAACGSSVDEAYFDTTDPIFARHSRTMADAEAAMFEQTSGTTGAVFAFGEDASTASTLIPIFRDAASAIERELAKWYVVEVPMIAGEYHSLIREAMSLRLGAMRDGAIALELIANGQAVILKLRRGCRKPTSGWARRSKRPNGFGVERRHRPGIRI
jgi:hypothetical protein